MSPILCRGYTEKSLLLYFKRIDYLLPDRYLARRNKSLAYAQTLHILPNNITNYEQREKRYRFYKKNGFKPTSYFINDEKDPTDYLIISTTGTFPKKAVEKLLRGLSYGTYKRRYKKKKKRKNAKVAN